MTNDLETWRVPCHECGAKGSAECVSARTGEPLLEGHSRRRKAQAGAVVAVSNHHRTKKLKQFRNDLMDVNKDDL